jgi:4-diphosphocytidyl-2-C-methyl-D-erythritol kinase
MPVRHAHAKINLSLEVLGRREDGYHDLISVMQTVSLADELCVETSVDFNFHCNVAALDTRHNLVVRAAEHVLASHHPPTSCSLTLVKHIPDAAGLGGGSSDAAETLMALDQLWSLRLPDESLVAHAADLGSDVPFFLTGGTAVVEGRGERVVPLPDPPLAWYVLAKPMVGLSTARVFRALPREEHSRGDLTRSLADSIQAHRPVAFGTNALQETAFSLCPEARACHNALRELANGEAILSGSGPTSVGLFGGRESAAMAAELLRGRGYWAVYVHSVTRGEQTA